MENQEDKSAQGIQSITQAQIDSLVDYPIPELGIKLKLPKDRAENIIYSYKENPILENSKQGQHVVGIAKSVGFSTKLLAEFNTYCAPKWSVLGAIDRYEGKPEDYSGPFVRREEGRKLFDTFFIMYSAPQAWCLSDEETQRYNEMVEKNGVSKEQGSGIRFEDIIPFAEKL